MKKIRAEKRLCECCMEEHEVQVVLKEEQNIFKGATVDYDAEYFYCDRSDEFYADENMIASNDIAMKNAYRTACGLLTTDAVVAIRKKYGISQSDLCIVLGWGGKTIARYEGHQVQDRAHDTILRKIDDDPEWFLSLLEAARSSLSSSTYEKSRNAGVKAYHALLGGDDEMGTPEKKSKMLELVMSHQETHRDQRKSFYYKGVETERVASLKSLMETMSFTLRQAMEALKIPSSEYEKYASVI